MTVVVSADSLWTNPLSWSLNRAPTHNDTLNIPLGSKIKVNVNWPTEYQNMRVNVSGILWFENGMKLNMCPGSVYVSPTGMLAGENSGSKINECGQTVWNGPGPDYGGASGTTYGNTLLPVELFAFSAVQKGDGILMAWSTASETNSSHFTVSRSINGIIFEDLVRLTGNGTTTQPHHYAFQDDAPADGTNYYRLKQTDFNGQEETFDLVAVNFVASAPLAVLSVYPNPVNGDFTVSLTNCPAEAGFMTLEILDATGRIVYTAAPERDPQGGFILRINPETPLNPGLYLVQCRSAKAVYQQKLMVRN
ncbi:MAG TPA: T9SS type A sorting domain-containing protein [Bacteroidia bacterium]|nr:T9SS type A sorting domain-containing protein [Bacteroidia bacterium]